MLLNRDWQPQTSLCASHLSVKCVWTSNVHDNAKQKGQLVPSVEFEKSMCKLLRDTGKESNSIMFNTYTPTAQASACSLPFSKKWRAGVNLHLAPLTAISIRERSMTCITTCWPLIPPSMRLCFSYNLTARRGTVDWLSFCSVPFLWFTAVSHIFFHRPFSDFTDKEFLCVQLVGLVYQAGTR